MVKPQSVQKAALHNRYDCKSGPAKRQVSFLRDKLSSDMTRQVYCWMTLFITLCLNMKTYQFLCHYITCSGLSPVKQNIPIWSMTCCQLWEEPFFFKPATSCSLILMMRLAIPWTSSSLDTKNKEMHNWASTFLGHAEDLKRSQSIQTTLV